MAKKKIFVPRHERLTLRIGGVNVIDVQLDREQAHAFNRAWVGCATAVSPTLHDRDVVTAITAVLVHTKEELKHNV